MFVPAFLPSLPLVARRATRHTSPTTVPHATYRVRYTHLGESRGLIFRLRATAPPPNAVPPVECSEVVDTHRLTAAVRARTVVHVCSSGTLCTASKRHSGVPFGSHADFILDAEGRPIFLLANNAMHTKNLGMEARCSLFCQPPSTYGQEGCRATLVGSMSKLPEEEVELRDVYVERHSHAADALKYPELFAFYRMQVKDVFFVGGYGVISQWVDVDHFATAEPDPLAFDAAEIVAGINENKSEELTRLCRVFLQVEQAAMVWMTSLDRLGFDLRVRNEGGEIREYRVAFREIVNNRFDVQSALVKAFQEAWERENGYDETWEGEDTRPTILYYAPS